MAAFQGAWSNHDVVLVEMSDLERAEQARTATSVEQADRLYDEMLDADDAIVGRILDQVDLDRDLVILLGLMAYIGAVMTLPGIAGFVLTMGIGVDSNVLIFERIKEELEAGRGVRASIDAGFNRVFWTLMDTHVAALISCAFLFQFGTGPIRGFAVTLVIGLLSNLFTSIFVSKTLFELALGRRHQVATLSI